MAQKRNVSENPTESQRVTGPGTFGMGCFRFAITGWNVAYHCRFSVIVAFACVPGVFPEPATRRYPTWTPPKRHLNPI